MTGIDYAGSEMGAVRAEVLGLREDARIETGMGVVSPAVDPTLDLQLLAQADGRLPVHLPLSDRSSGPGQVAGRLNDGGHRLHVRSEFGDVTVRTLGWARYRSNADFCDVSKEKSTKEGANSDMLTRI